MVEGFLAELTADERAELEQLGSVRRYRLARTQLAGRAASRDVPARFRASGG